MDSEVQLLLCNGQRDRAFEKILDAYENKVFRLILSLLRDHGRAEEVAQDTFLRVWQGLGEFDPKRGAIGTWIYAIARNTALSRVRSESYRRTVPLEQVAEPYAPCGNGAGDIRRLVDRLPEELREVLMLYYYQERSVEEVGRMLDIPAGTVKSHLFRARRALGEIMKGGRS